MSRTDRRSQAANAWRKLYGKAAWQALRATQLATHPLCGRHRGRAVPATVVNHRTPHKGDLALFLDPANLESVCKPCHDGPIQRAEALSFSPAVDASGFPTDPAHPANRPPRGGQDR